MGGKHIRGRQYIYLCFTILIHLILFGCATIESTRNRHTIYKRLQHSQKLLAKGDFKGALLENQKVLSLFDKALYKDNALFNIGLIYAHYGNPEKDYKESRKYFEKIIQLYPQSPLLEQAKIWIRVLKEIIDSKIKNNETTSKKYLNRAQEFLVLGRYRKAFEKNKDVLSLPDENSHKDEALFNIGLIYAHYNNPEKDYKKSRFYFKELIKKYPQSPLNEQAKIWLGILNVIEREKQVDIEIEKKKKELIR